MLTAWDMISSIRFMACTAAGCGYTSTTPGGGYTQPIQTAPPACVPTGQFCFAGSTCCEGSCLPYEPNMGICGPSETVPTNGANASSSTSSASAPDEDIPLEITPAEAPDPVNPPQPATFSFCGCNVNLQCKQQKNTCELPNGPGAMTGFVQTDGQGGVNMCISTDKGLGGMFAHELTHAKQVCSGGLNAPCCDSEFTAYNAQWVYIATNPGTKQAFKKLAKDNGYSVEDFVKFLTLYGQNKSCKHLGEDACGWAPFPANFQNLYSTAGEMGDSGSCEQFITTPEFTDIANRVCNNDFSLVVTTTIPVNSGNGNTPPQGSSSSVSSESSSAPYSCPPSEPPPPNAPFPVIKEYVNNLNYCSTFTSAEESSSSAGIACFACFYQDIACDTLSVQNCGKIKPAGADWASDCVVRGNACVNTFKQDCDAAVAAAPESPRAASFAGTQLRDVFREDCTQRRYQVEGHGTPGMLPQVVRQISMCAGGCAPGTTSAITINSCSVFQNVNTAQVYMQSIVNQYPQATFTVTGYMNPTAPGNPGASVTFCAAGQSSSVSVQFGPCHTQSNVCYIQNGVATATTRCTDENGAAKWETCCAVTKPFTPLTGQPGVSAGEYYRGDSTNVNCPAQSTTPAYCNFGGGCYGTAPGTTQSCSPANYYGSGTPAPVSRVCCMKVAHTYQEWMPGTTCPSLLCAPDGTGCLDNTKPACRSSEFVSTPDKVQLCCFNSGSTAGTTIVADSADEACPASCSLGTSYCSSEGKTVQCVNGTRLSYQTCCSAGDGTRDLKWYIEGRCPMGGAPVQASSASSTPAPVTSACNATSPAPTQKSCTVKDMINTSQWPWTVAANTQCLNNGSVSEERCCSVLKPGAPSVTLEWTMVPQGGSCPAVNLPFCQFSQACQDQGSGSAQCLLGLSVKNRLCCQQFADDPTKKVWKEPVNGACPALNANACKSPANITDLRSPLLVNTCTKSQFLTTTTCQDPGTLGTPTTESCCKRIVDSEEYVWIRSSVSGCPAALPAYCPAIDSACLSDARKINGCSQKNGNTITSSAVICCQNQDPAAAGTPAAQLHWLSGSACPANYKKRATVNLPAVTLEDTQSTCPAASANVSTLIRNAWTAASGNCVNQGGTIYPTSIGTAASACTMGTPQSQGWWWSPTCKARAQCTFVCANALVPYSQN